MYTIIGGDKKEYGPISTNDVRQWIAEGRLNEQTLMKAESDAEFRPLGKFPEFADAFASKPPASNTPPPLTGTPESAPVEREYDLDIFGSFSRGWELVKNNMGLLFVGALIYFLIEMAMGVLGSIPVIGPVFSIGNFIISGPLMGGLFYLFLRTIRDDSPEVGDVFSGFRRAFGQLFLGAFIQALFIGLCMLPFIIIFLVKFLPLMGHLEHMQPGTPPDPETIRALTSVFMTCLPVLAICAIPAIYLSVSWKFTLPLIVDKELGFWAAMQTSRRQVGKHWWQVFGLLILIGLLNMAGMLLCCVGTLLTFPIGIAALMFAYETIFPEGPSASRATARNAALLNQLATPGLGSLIGRRWIAGAGQLLIFLLGFILFCAWNFNTVATYYQLAFSDITPPPDQWGSAGWLGVVLCVIAWLWAAVTSFSLLREATTGKRQALENFAAPPPLKLDESKILPALATVPQWHLQDTAITRIFEFKDFPAAIKFVQAVAELAELAWHHPDIDIRWNKVTLTLTTHDAGGLTEKDFALARQFDKL